MTWVGLVLSPLLARPVPGSEELIALSANLEVEEDLDRVVKELNQLALLSEAGVLLLQEVTEGPGRDPFAHDLAGRLGFPFCFAPSRYSDEEPVSPKLAILSRFPMVEQSLIELSPIDLVFKSRRRYALDVVLDTTSGRVRVVNLHLDSRINVGDRLLQLESILEQTSGESNPLLIGGDFNSNNFFWFWHMLPIPFVSNQSARLVQELSDHGFTTPFVDLGPTHDLFRLKLDWIFGRSIFWEESGILPLGFSDHHLIWTRFRFEKPIVELRPQ